MRRISFSEGEYYHIYNRGVDKRIVFTSSAEYKRFQIYLQVLNDVETARVNDIFRGGVKNAQGLALSMRDRRAPMVAIGAYCLMPNHFHLYVTPLMDSGISKFMQRIQTAYTMFFNEKHKRSGALFQGTFKAEHVDSDRYARYLLSYIHLNPAKLVDRTWKEFGARDFERVREHVVTYPYSSLPEYRDRSHVICEPSKFPSHLSSIREIDDHVDEWLSHRRFSRLNLEHSAKRGFISNRILLVVAGLVAITLTAFTLTLKPYQVVGVSMESTFKGGELLLVSHLPIDIRGIKRGDVVVFRRGNETDIKRIVGIPGDHLSITPAKVSITDADATTIEYGESGVSGTIDRYLRADEYFVLGDNRRQSEDSRKWGGAVVPANIIGIPIVRTIPTSRFSLFPGAI